MDLKMYKRPLASLTITGDKVRATPGVLSKFSSALAKRLINIYAVSVGECSVSFFIDEKDLEKARKSLEKAVLVNSSFNSLSMMKGLGMLTITSHGFLKIPGIISKLAEPLARKRLNIIAISSSMDSLMMFFEWKDLRRACETLHVAIVRGF